MRHLDEFLARLKDEGVEIAQDYPPNCVPIAESRIVLPVERYTPAPAGL